MRVLKLRHHHDLMLERPIFVWNDVVVAAAEWIQIAGFYPYRFFRAYQHNKSFMMDDGGTFLGGHSFASES